MVDQTGKVIVLVSADIEWRALKTLFPRTEDQRSPYGNWFQASIGPSIKDPAYLAGQVRSGSHAVEPNQDVIFFHGGWGKIAAAGSTQYVIDRWNPALLVNLGTCGGFEGHIDQGEVILANQTTVYDIIELMGDFDEHIAHYSTELDIGWFNENVLPFPVRKTLLVSGDRDLLASEIPGLNARYGALAGDWESGAIAWVAERNQTRLLIFRGVSDIVRSEGSEAYGNLDYFAASTEKIMAKLLGVLPACLSQTSARLE